MLIGPPPLPVGVKFRTRGLGLMRYFSSPDWSLGMGVRGGHNDSRAMQGSDVESVTSRFPAVGQRGNQKPIPETNGVSC